MYWVALTISVFGHATLSAFALWHWVIIFYNGQKFYKATASIDKTELTNKHGGKRNIKTGMLVESHTITGTQSIMTWLLDKLSFI